MKSRYLHAATVRRLGLGTLVDTFLVSAATCLLSIRTILAATGWPQLGNDTLHIAHMLWGGLGMLVALFMVFVFPGRHAIIAASVVGGLGFGAFIDELGKFITSDNNYFFEPTIGLIYIIFIVLYLAGRALERTTQPSQKTYIVNAMDMTKDAFIVGLGHKQREQALEYLAQCDPSEPLVGGLQKLLQELEPVVPEPSGRLARAGAAVRRFYDRLIGWPAFAWVMTAIVVAFVAANVAWMVALTFGWTDPVNVKDLTFGQSGQIVGTLISGVLGLAGGVVFWSSRILAYRLFDYAVLASIFITQIFRFWEESLAAITGLVICLALHLILSYAIGREHEALSERTRYRYASAHSPNRTRK